MGVDRPGEQLERPGHHWGGCRDHRPQTLRMQYIAGHRLPNLPFCRKRNLGDRTRDYPHHMQGVLPLSYPAGCWRNHQLQHDPLSDPIVIGSNLVVACLLAYLLYLLTYLLPAFALHKSTINGTERRRFSSSVVSVISCPFANTCTLFKFITRSFHVRLGI